MAAGEYVSVRAQNDLVARELDKERQALVEDPEEETEELAQLYVERGLTIDQAREMAQLVILMPLISWYTFHTLGYSTWTPLSYQMNH